MTNQSIFRVAKNAANPYVMINKENIEDEDLSWKAKGILHYLLSKPDDWQVYESDIVKRATDGKDSVNSGLQELMEAGYIKRSTRRDEKGRFAGYEYHVYEIPPEKLKGPENADMTGKCPKPDFPVSDNPKSGNPQLLRNEGTKNERTYTYTTLRKSSRDLIHFYDQTYQHHFDRPHPRIKEDGLRNIECLLEVLTTELNVEQQELAMAVEYHFSNLPYGNDGKMQCFARPEYLMRVLDEVGTIVGYEGYEMLRDAED